MVIKFVVSGIFFNGRTGWKIGRDGGKIAEPPDRTSVPSITHSLTKLLRFQRDNHLSRVAPISPKNPSHGAGGYLGMPHNHFLSIYSLVTCSVSSGKANPRTRKKRRSKMHLNPTVSSRLEEAWHTKSKRKPPSSVNSACHLPDVVLTIVNTHHLWHSDSLYKILLIGDSGVGKSCLLMRFAVGEPSRTDPLLPFSHWLWNCRTIHFLGISIFLLLV